MALNVPSGVLNTDTFDLDVKLLFLIGNLIVSGGNIIVALVFSNNVFHCFLLYVQTMSRVVHFDIFVLVTDL